MNKILFLTLLAFFLAPLYGRNIQSQFITPTTPTTTSSDSWGNYGNENSSTTTDANSTTDTTSGDSDSDSSTDTNGNSTDNSTASASQTTTNTTIASPQTTSSSTQTVTQTPPSTEKKIVVINNVVNKSSLYTAVNNLYLYLKNGTASSLVATVAPQAVTTANLSTTQVGDLFVTDTQLSTYPSLTGSTPTRFYQPTTQINTTDKPVTEIFTVSTDAQSGEYLFNRINATQRSLIINNSSKVDLIVRIDANTTAKTGGIVGAPVEHESYLFYRAPANRITIINAPTLVPHTEDNATLYQPQTISFSFKAHPSQAQLQAINSVGNNKVTFSESGKIGSNSYTVKNNVTTAIYTVTSQATTFNTKIELTVSTPTTLK